MENTKDKRYLSHLKDCIPEHANNYMLSTYTIILEAWRRGLEIDIKIIKQKSGKIAPHYSISNNEKTHKFSVSRGDLVSPEGTKIAMNKHLTKEYLLQAGVDTPKGDDFDESNTNDDILKYANNAGYPLVLKPIDGTGGKGVIANIKNDEEMEHAIQYVRGELKSKNVIVEQHFEGEDHRLYVVDDEVVGVFKRDPASVRGNGKDTIQKLLKKKNEERMKIPSVKGTPITVDSESKELLRRLGYTMQSVPKDGEVVFLKSKSNVSSGGEAVDVTDETTDEMKQIAVNATKAIPTLVQGGVDMMIDKENNQGVVLEINSRAHIRTHLYPSYGKGRDVPTAIIDHYFPETKGYDREDPNKMYLDYDFIYHACMSRTATNIRLPKIPTSPIVLKRYVISGAKYTEQFAIRVRRLAFNNRVHGYIKPLKDSNIGIVLGGRENNVDEFFKQFKRYVNRNSKNPNITEKNRTTPIKHGFHITDIDSSHDENQEASENSPDKYSELRNDYQKLVQKLAEYEQQESVMALTKKQNKQLKKKLDHMEKSSSWKVTKPIRYIGGKFK